MVYHALGKKSLVAVQLSLKCLPIEELAQNFQANIQGLLALNERQEIRKS